MPVSKTWRETTRPLCSATAARGINSGSAGKINLLKFNTVHHTCLLEKLTLNTLLNYYSGIAVNIQSNVIAGFWRDVLCGILGCKNQTIMQGVNAFDLCNRVRGGAG